MAVGRFALPIQAGSAEPAEPTTGTWQWGRPKNGNASSSDSIYNVLYKRVSDVLWDRLSMNSIMGIGIVNGELWVWGNNSWGGTGQGTTSDSTYTTLTRIGSDNDWTHCSCSGPFNAPSVYAIRAGRLYVSGYNANGQLGLGDTTARTSFTQVGSDTDWEFVSAGYNYGVAIKGGKLYTCGSNADYRTGLNTNSGNTTSWSEADSNIDWSDVAGGFDSGVGIRGGLLYSWGRNTSGGTAQGTTSGNTQIPTQVGVLTNWVKVSCGVRSGAVINSSGELFVFGWAGTYNLGNGSTSNVTSPTKIGSDTDWELIAQSNFLNTSVTSYMIAIKGGKIFGCGHNEYAAVDGIGTSSSVNNWAEQFSATNHSFIATCGGYTLAVRT